MFALEVAMRIAQLVFVMSALVLTFCASAQLLATQTVATGITQPTYVTAPPGDDDRLFVVTLNRFGFGNIRVVNLRNNTVAPTFYLTVGPVGNGAEQGMYCMAFHPRFMENGYFYVTYTEPAVSGVTAGDLFLVRYRATNGNPMSSTPESTHNGGWIAFGADDYLYLATGDGGNANDTNGGTSFPPFHTPGIGNAQDLTDNLLGKILRLDVDGPDGQPGTADDDGFPANDEKFYHIPPTNPYVGTENTPEIWANGLRNPWRCSFDRETGDFWSGDVGQAEREELNRNIGNIPAANYGWRCMEGTRCTGLAGCTCNDPTLVFPLYEYDHTLGCAVVGGYVYRGGQIPWLRGTYFYTDFCSAEIKSFRPVGNTVTEFTDRTVELDPPGPSSWITLTSFGEDARGDLYIVDLNAGRISRIVEPGPLVDCNGNGRGDRGDIAAGVSRDRNSDGIPDECQPPPCFADFNQDGGVDGSDVEAFFVVWATGSDLADTNLDGGVDGADVETFFTQWQAGGC
jgi:glucose/arabinose dehydrogenase